MFTGIVEAIGRVEAFSGSEETKRLRIGAPTGFLQGSKVGDSISVDGACLTVVALDATGFEVDVIATTLGRTVANRYKVGVPVNLERAMQIASRIDGHLVQGHVDGVAHLISVVKEGDGWRLTVSLPPELHLATILHGSITLNGVSLTVNRLLPEHQIEIGIIPHTWSHTNLGTLVVGDPLNVEGDMIGKYVRRWLEGMQIEPHRPHLELGGTHGI